MNLTSIQDMLQELKGKTFANSNVTHNFILKNKQEVSISYNESDGKFTILFTDRNITEQYIDVASASLALYKTFNEEENLKTVLGNDSQPEAVQ
ncbi:hypothetical protein [Mesobacillus harenae]|uniref:hypothetical protein n=1 Tax=Mesobacillus harenae TaxID=2213203 RepID=UPI00158059C3|nr:hypothetical protein [Mesobacillus harenae]